MYRELKANPPSPRPTNIQPFCVPQFLKELQISIEDGSPRGDLTL